MELMEINHQQQLPHNSCLCKACLFQPKVLFQVQPSDVRETNSINQLIKILPVSFVIQLEQTVIVNRQEDGGIQLHSYSNNYKDQRRKWNLIHQQLRSISSLPSQNVIIYFKNREKIVPRFQVGNYMAGGKYAIVGDEALYLQPYQPRPIVRTQYHCEKKCIPDDLLIEHLKKEEDRYRLHGYKPNEQFLEWVYREYGEYSFCLFLTELYCKLFKALTNNTIKKAIFFWVLEPLKSNSGGSGSEARAQYDNMISLGRPRKLNFRPKLVNIKGLEVILFQRLYSFQDEYAELIKKRIYDNPGKKAINNIKSKAYRSRLQSFRQKLQKVYKKEQEIVLSKVQEEKNFQFQQDSDQMARLLIPNLPKDKTLRQVLCDQTAFRKLIGKADSKRIKTEPSRNALPSMMKKVATLTEKNWKTVKKQSGFNQYSVHKRLKVMRTPSTHEG